MKRKIITTGDGSKTIQLVDWDEQYHSVHGAVQEAQHVFLKMGLEKVSAFAKEIHILEIGFGTGLNAYLTLLATKNTNLTIHYTGVEAYPVSMDEATAMDYPAQLQQSENEFNQLHTAQWEIWNTISPNFNFRKQKNKFKHIDDIDQYDLIYFDAFGPRHQPDLWDLSMFQRMYKATKSNGVLVTYCAKGQVRRNMQEAGFTIERLPGPPGKREMLRASR